MSIYAMSYSCIGGLSGCDVLAPTSFLRQGVTERATAGMQYRHDLNVDRTETCCSRLRHDG